MFYKATKHQRMKLHLNFLNIPLTATGCTMVQFQCYRNLVTITLDIILRLQFGLQLDVADDIMTVIKSNPDKGQSSTALCKHDSI